MSCPPCAWGTIMVALGAVGGPERYTWVSAPDYWRWKHSFLQSFHLSLFTVVDCKIHYLISWYNIALFLTLLVAVINLFHPLHVKVTQTILERKKDKDDYYVSSIHRGINIVSIFITFWWLSKVGIDIIILIWDCKGILLYREKLRKRRFNPRAINNWVLHCKSNFK